MLQRRVADGVHSLSSSEQQADVQLAVETCVVSDGCFSVSAVDKTIICQAMQIEVLKAALAAKTAELEAELAELSAPPPSLLLQEGCLRLHLNETTEVTFAAQTQPTRPSRKAKEAGVVAKVQRKSSVAGRMGL